MNDGLQRLHEQPLSLRPIGEIHDVLPRDGRGATRDPGAFRDQQNWFGAGGVPMTRATYVPPHPELQPSQTTGRAS
jgi:hypothetical protein